MEMLVKVWDILKVRKRWWLLPITIMLIITGLLIIFGGDGYTPFEYVLK